MDLRKFLTLNLCHFFIDLCAGIFGPLVAVVRMAPASIGFYGSLFSACSCFSQLLFGYLADRGMLHRFVIGGLVVAVVCLLLTGPAVSSGATFALLLVGGGLGLAAFHPAGTVLAAKTAGNRRALGVSIFVVAGTCGYAASPLVTVRFIEAFGRERIPILAIPMLTVALVAFFVLRRKAPLPANTSAAREGNRLRRTIDFVGTYGPSILPLYLLVVVRSMLQISMTSFLPRLMVDWGHTDSVAALSSTCFTLGGAMGMLLGGALMSRCDRRWIQIVSFFGGIPCALLFLLADLPLPVGYALLTFSGLFMLSTNSMHIVMGQEIAPSYASVVTSLMMGVGWGVGAIGPALVGALTSYLTLAGALSVVAALPILTVPLVFFFQGRPHMASTIDAEAPLDPVTG